MIQIISENVMLRISALIAVFLLVAAGAFVLSTSLANRQSTRRRLAASAVPDRAAGATLTSSLRGHSVEGVWMKLVNAIEKSGLSLDDSKADVLREKLAAAGFSNIYAPRIYTLVRLVLVIALPLLTLGLLYLGGSSPSLLRVYGTLTAASLAGLYIPTLFIRAKAARRQRQLIDDFPDALDLLLVCVEAGLGLEAAFARVGMEMTTAHPLLAKQLGVVVLELRAGRSREDALRRMAQRAGADEIRAFATLLIQSTKLGSSIAQTLRVYAAEMRERRRMRAEEKAHRLPVLLSIPLVTCMLPVMIGVLMLPAVIRVMRTLLPAMGGGS